MGNKFTIGASFDDYPGLAKLLEEVGEFSQVAGKLIATDGDPEHWDGDGSLIDRLVEELADMKAAISWMEARCKVVYASLDEIDFRVRKKLGNYFRFAEDEAERERLAQIKWDEEAEKLRALDIAKDEDTRLSPTYTVQLTTTDGAVITYNGCTLVSVGDNEKVVLVDARIIDS